MRRRTASAPGCGPGARFGCPAGLAGLGRGSAAATAASPREVFTLTGNYWLCSGCVRALDPSPNPNLPFGAPGSHHSRATRGGGRANDEGPLGDTAAFSGLDAAGPAGFPVCGAGGGCSVRPASGAARATPAGCARSDLPRLEGLPQPYRLPRQLGWLLRMVSGTAAYAGQVQRLLADPEMAALLAGSPQAGHILRPLCRMLGIQPEPGLLRRRREPPPGRGVRASPVGGAGLGDEAAAGAGPLDALFGSGSELWPLRPRERGCRAERLSTPGPTRRLCPGAELNRAERPASRRIRDVATAQLCCAKPAREVTDTHARDDPAGVC